MSLLRRVARRAYRLIRRRVPDPLDAQVVKVLTQILKANSNCVDVGAHHGAMLEHMVRLAPEGRNVAVEPLPRFAAELRRRFPQVTVHEAALADENGSAEFQHVVTNPAYSGLRQRRYDRPKERVSTINVLVRRLDDLVEPGHRIDVVKIDVEGGELGVLRGASRVLSESRPTIIFEHGLGAADFYGTKPRDVHELLTEKFAMEVFTLAGWLSRNPPLELAAMADEFEKCRSYMFVAVPRRQ